MVVRENMVQTTKTLITLLIDIMIVHVAIGLNSKIQSKSLLVDFIILRFRDEIVCY